MRTTLDLAEDVLISAKELARQQKRSAGEVISELARIGLQSSVSNRDGDDDGFLGFVPILPNGLITPNGQVNLLREQLGEE